MNESAEWKIEHAWWGETANQLFEKFQKIQDEEDISDAELYTIVAKIVGTDMAEMFMFWLDGGDWRA